MIQDNYSLLLAESIKLIRMNTVALVKIQESTHLVNDIGLNCSELADLIDTFENHFEVELPQHKLCGVEIISQLVRLIASSRQV